MITSVVYSEHLITSHRKNISDLIERSELSMEDTIDILISLHIVLEVGLNSFFRCVVVSSINAKQFDEYCVIENMDKISFIDKTVLFIYNSKFDFSGHQEEFREHHKIIDLLRDFSEIRNKLLHGHAIATFYGGASGETRQSKLKKKISLESLQKQIISFRKILAGLRFYLDHLQGTIKQSGKQSLVNMYLDDSFLPVTHFGEVK